MKILQTILMSAAITTSGAGFAADKKANPLGLVYGGAITENIKGQVNIHQWLLFPVLNLPKTFFS